MCMYIYTETERDVMHSYRCSHTTTVNKRRLNRVRTRAIQRGWRT